MCARSWNWFSLPRQRPGGEGSSEGCPLRLMHPDSLFTGTLKSLPCLQRAPGQADDGNTGQGRIPLSLHGERRRRDPQNKADPAMEGLLHPHWREGEFPPTQRGLAAWGDNADRAVSLILPSVGCTADQGLVVWWENIPIPSPSLSPSHLIPSHPILPYPIISCLIPSQPFPSHPISSQPFPSHPFLTTAQPVFQKTFNFPWRVTAKPEDLSKLSMLSAELGPHTGSPRSQISQGKFLMGANSQGLSSEGKLKS